jgi:hypothetical protein
MVTLPLLRLRLLALNPGTVGRIVSTPASTGEFLDSDLAMRKGYSDVEVSWYSLVPAV